ncbi:MAG: FUSC family protein [Gemmatimonadales bacterium]
MPALRSSKPALVPIHRALSEVRAATALAPARPDFAAGLRAGLATVVPLVVDHVLALGGGTWMSLAGFSGALADKGGPYRTRAATLGALTVTGSLAAMLGTLAGVHPALAIPVSFLVAVACSLGRAYGTAGASVGVASLSIYVIALAYPPEPGSGVVAAAFTRGGFVVIGSAWAMLVALVLWPLRPFRPVRLAVAGAYRALADYADEVAMSSRRGEIATNPPRVRAALEVAHAALATVRRGRPGESGRGERLVVLGEVADQVFGQLFGLSDIAESTPVEARDTVTQAALADAVAGFAATMRALADGVEAEDGFIPVAVTWSGNDLRVRVSSNSSPDQAASVPEGDEARLHYEQAAMLLDRMAQYAGVAAATAAGLNSGAPASPLERALEVEDPEARPGWLAPLQASLSWDSVMLRFALRVGLITAVAVALTAAFDLKRGYWVTLTAGLILQPYTGATSVRAVQRVLGTVVGGILTAALAALFHDPRAIVVLVFVFAVLSVALLPLNYAAFSVFLTPTFVLLAEATTGDWHLAGVRILNTVLGGGLALVGSRVLWPSPEAERLPVYLGEIMTSLRGYLAGVVERFEDRSDEAGRRLREQRRQVGLAILNAEESFQRLLGEHRGPPEALAPVMTLLTYTRRFTASIAALALSRHSVDAVSSETIAPFVRVADTALADLVTALGSGRAPRPLPELPELSAGTVSPLLRGRLTRLGRQLKTLHDAAARWIEGLHPAAHEG